MTVAPTGLGDDPTVELPTARPAPATAPPAPGAALPGARRFGSGLRRARLRILGWFVLLVAGAVLGGLLVQRQALLARLDRDLAATMRQELEELETLATGVDPTTGVAFNSVPRLFDLALARNVPLDGEVVATFVGGRPYRASAGGDALYGDSAFVRRAAATTGTVEGSVTTPDGAVRYIARPVRFVRGDGTGVFVAGVFVDNERAEVEAAITTSALVAVAILLAASSAAWVVAGRVLRPVREVTDAAREIGETDLRRRIPVVGDDEIAELAVTFNEMLDRLDRSFAAQRAFLDDAGHELRTPITIVQGNLDLLAVGAGDRDEAMAVIQDELDRMTRIVDDLLLLARAERADFLRLAPVDVATLVGDLAARSATLDERPWSLIAPPPGLVVVADRERLLQALLNLAANAARHTPPGTPVRMGADRLPGGGLRLWVSDDGPGVPPGERERIFGRFARGSHPSGARDRGGAGLGLAIATAIAEAHGGRLDLDHHGPGSGATFSIVLPTSGSSLPRYGPHHQEVSS